MGVRAYSLTSIQESQDNVRFVTDHGATRSTAAETRKGFDKRSSVVVVELTHEQPWEGPSVALRAQSNEARDGRLEDDGRDGTRAGLQAIPDPASSTSRRFLNVPPIGEAWAKHMGGCRAPGKHSLTCSESIPRFCKETASVTHPLCLNDEKIPTKGLLRRMRSTQWTGI